MGKALVVVLILIGIAGLSFGMFMAGYEYHQPREIIVDRWHEPEVIIVEPLEFEVLRIETVSTSYEPLPGEFILEQAIYSHQYYIDNDDVSKGSRAWHQRTIDKYELSIIAFEYLQINKDE